MIDYIYIYILILYLNFGCWNLYLSISYYFPDDFIVQYDECNVLQIILPFFVKAMYDTC